MTKESGSCYLPGLISIPDLQRRGSQQETKLPSDSKTGKVKGGNEAGLEVSHIFKTLENLGQAWWLIPINLVTYEAENWRIVVQVQPRAKSW
jgi:hypothetical protein